MKTSKYDSIQTAVDLVREVQINGLSLSTEDICRAQDIFGHSTVEELDALANDIGRTNGHGEPDPKGTWGDGRRGTRDTFYSILFHIWNWEDATRFWNQHSNIEHEELAERRSSQKSLESQVAELKTQKEELQRVCKESSNATVDAWNKLREQEDRAEAAEAEIVKLKAKLYDLMVAGKEGA